MNITGSLQTKNNKYYMVLYIPDKTGAKRQKWEATGLNVTSSNKRKAERMLSTRILNLESLCVPLSDITVAEYLRDWLDEIKEKVRPNTYHGYYSNMTKHIIPYFEKQGTKLQELRIHHLEEYYDWKIHKDGLSPTTVKHHHQNISKALSDAMRKELISVNPASAAVSPKMQAPRVTILEKDEVRELLRLVKGTQIEIPVTLCAVYGLRRSEVLGLTWENVDLSREEIRIEQTYQQHVGEDYFDTTKTEKSRRALPMTSDVKELLTRHRQEQERMKELLGDRYRGEDFVCTMLDRNEVRLIHPNYLTVSFRKLIARSGLPQVRLHDLRHSVASNLLEDGFSLVDVQEWMGHAHPSTTLDIYSHPGRKAKRHIAEAIEHENLFEAQECR